MRDISGQTRIIAHLGVPTESFRAPLIYNPYFEDIGRDCAVVPMGCEAAEFRAFLPLVARLRNFAGALITMPHKTAAVDLLDRASRAVRICGACNAVKCGPDGKLIGDMFDGAGLVRGLLRKRCRIEGAAALIVGCGGVGSAIAAALADSGAECLGLSDVNPVAADRLARRLAEHFPQLTICRGIVDPAGWDIVVNATPLGMAPADPMPVDTGRLSADTWVAEVVLTRARTAFVAAAQARGCQTVLGTDMLFEQIPAYLEFFDLPTTTPDNLRRVARLPDKGDT